MSSFSLSPSGFPARFCVARTALSTLLTHNIGLGTEGLTLVLQGIDASASFSCVEADAWLSMGTPGNKCVFFSRTVDLATDGTYVHGSWRGDFPISSLEGCEIGIEAQIPCDLALMAWGIWLPHVLGITL